MFDTTFQTKWFVNVRHEQMFETTLLANMLLNEKGSSKETDTPKTYRLKTNTV